MTLLCNNIIKRSAFKKNSMPKLNQGDIKMSCSNRIKIDGSVAKLIL